MIEITLDHDILKNSSKTLHLHISKNYNKTCLLLEYFSINLLIPSQKASAFIFS